MIQPLVARAGTNSLGGYHSTDSASYDSDSKPDTTENVELDLDNVDTVYKEELFDLKQWQKPPASSTRNQLGSLSKQERMVNPSYRPKGQRRTR